MGARRNPKRAMFIGTCRMHDPVRTLLSCEDLTLRITPHRFHTPGQTVQFVQHMSGGPRYLPSTMHLASDYAAQQIFVENTSREQLLLNLNPLMNIWTRFAVFVIEICSLREHIAEWNGKPLIVNTFASRDQVRYGEQLAAQAAAGLSLPALPIAVEKLGVGATHRQMRLIKTTLGGRPIIWVSHQRPPSDDAEYSAVNSVRLAVAEKLRAGAQALGDVFFDPSGVAAEMGQKAFFQKDGTDLDHMTLAGATRLGEIYRQMILDLACAWRNV